MVRVGFFAQTTINSIRRNHLKCCHRRFILNTRRTSFHGKGCQALEQPAQGKWWSPHSLEVFKRCGDVALRDMG